jgi:predicted DCC family thiol-disulfide oxidoreductase YuxK
MKTSTSRFSGMEGHPVIVFDGVCHLCNRSVQFVLKRDRKGIFRFATLGSEFARAILQREMDLKGTDSVWLVKDGRVYFKTAAVLRILTGLGGLWSLAGFFFIVPGFIRDPVYDWIARHRYRWFGRYDSCMVPPPDILSRFLP